MMKSCFSDTGREPLSRPKFFLKTPQGPWTRVRASCWNDWHWQLRQRIASYEKLSGLMRLVPAEEEGIRTSGGRLAMSITPYFFNLIDPDNPACPIRRQVVPRTEETVETVSELSDPCGEDEHSPVPGVVHRYGDRVLLLVTDRCATYCRHCTRSRMVSGAGGRTLETDMDRALDYIRGHREIRDVLLSGGDPLVLSDGRLAFILNRLRAIKHVEFLRIGTRAPVVLPQRITPALCAMLRRFHPLWISVHVNHPRELTAESRTALERLADAGIPLGSQSVLLAGVNDDAETLRELFEKLLICRVRPYYLYQCDLARGTSHLRVSVRRGIGIMDAIRGHTSGYAVPTYVIDAPGGGGKIPVGPNYIVAHDRRRILIRNRSGKVYEYPEIDPLVPRLERAGCGGV